MGNRPERTGSAPKIGFTRSVVASGAVTIGFIGFGTIAREIAANLHPGEAKRLIALVREHPAREVAPDIEVVTKLDALLLARPDIVVEAAAPAALAEFGPAILAAGLPLVVASVGAFADGALLEECLRHASAGGGRIIVPAGAVGGLDYLAAVRNANASVRYTSRKPLAAWHAELAEMGLDLARLNEEIVLFEGSPDEAARRYPKNLNVALTIALAAGPTRTAVRVVADPGVVRNTHEIEVESSVGTAFLKFENRPSAMNPKTSAVTALSLLSALRRHFDSLVI